MFLELVVNATVATATAATQAMNVYNIDSAATALASYSTAPTTATTATAADSAAASASSPVACSSCPLSARGYNISFPEADGARNGLAQSPAVSTLRNITDAYMNAHGVVSFVTCALGIPMNVLNIWVLTRRHMRTPVNCILTWLAVFDLLTMLSYVPFSLHFYLLWSPRELSAEKNSLGWMTFIIFHSGFTGTTHLISIWLGVTLAMFRYKHIFSPAKGHITRVRRLVRARIAVFVVVVASIVVMIPNYLMNRIMQHVQHLPETNETVVVFYIEELRLGTPEMKPMTGVNLWMQCILAKFLPCILMVVYSGLLVRTVRMNVRMLERRRNGSGGLGRRPSDSVCGTRLSLAEHSSDGDYSVRKNIDIVRSSKNKKHKNKELNKSQELLDETLDKLFSTKNENGKTESGCLMRQSPNMKKSQSQEYVLYTRCSSNCNGSADQPCVNGTHERCLNVPLEPGHCLCLPEQIHPSENHSHDSGIYSNASHDQLTYEQQCQLNLKQKGSTDVSKSNPNGSTGMNNFSNEKGAGHSPYNMCPAQQAYNTRHLDQGHPQRGSMSTVAASDTMRRARASSTGTTTGIPVSTSRNQDSVRTTRMLLVVIILFLVTELPQGILIALSVTIPGFFDAVYIPLGDIMDQLALLNNGINFLLYCSMSRDFRTTLLQQLQVTPTWFSWCTSSNGSSSGGNCSPFTGRQRERKQMVVANDV
ncbi:B1 bradykinin receptor [Plakobranchus ocellatus]|uniref:B1 bradykinin receptor n=1 Tax=Plakobranchus ocellatus TaxID=259542 RepID=A0AAV3Y3H0_9GAST|nr:B1 bradykinin receptor [Plakobranchus ocellatus]